MARAISLCRSTRLGGRGRSSALPIVVSDEASIDCTRITTRSPWRATDPSTTASTFDSRAIFRKPVCPRPCNASPRCADTRRARSLARSQIERLRHAVRKELVCSDRRTGCAAGPPRAPRLGRTSNRLAASEPARTSSTRRSDADWQRRVRSLSRLRSSNDLSAPGSAGSALRSGSRWSTGRRRLQLRLPAERASRTEQLVTTQPKAHASVR